MNRTLIARSLAAFALLGGSVANADFVQPQSWTRGGFGSTYQEWEFFTGLFNQAPDVADVNPNGSASLSESGNTVIFPPGPTGVPTGAFVTGGGNIYSFATATEFDVTIPVADVPVPPHNVTAIVQIETLGSELDYANVLLNGLPAVDTAELSRGFAGGPFGGAAVESWFLFNVPHGVFTDGQPGPDNLELTFNASSSSMSLVQISVDTAIRPGPFYAEPNPIPEPSAFASAMALALVVAARRR